VVFSLCCSFILQVLVDNVSQIKLTPPMSETLRPI
jgi:hypothetical protein